MDLALPQGLAKTGPAVPGSITSTDSAIETTYPLGRHTLKVRYAKSGKGVEVRAAWQGGVPQERLGHE